MRGKIDLKEFQVDGCDIFYTNVVLQYISKLNVDYVSTCDDIERLKEKVVKLSTEKPNPFISKKINVSDLINMYFTALQVKLRNILEEDAMRI